MASGIKVKCKGCGKMADSSEFVLDPGFKMMVCRNCVKDRQMREQVKKEVKEETTKPKDWDIEDEQLTRLAKKKQENTVTVQHLDKDRVKYQCPKCKYAFVIKLDRMVPDRCPYCGMKVLNFE